MFLCTKRLKKSILSPFPFSYCGYTDLWAWLEAHGYRRPVSGCCVKNRIFHSCELLQSPSLGSVSPQSGALCRRNRIPGHPGSGRRAWSKGSRDSDFGRNRRGAEPLFRSSRIKNRCRSFWTAYSPNLTTPFQKFVYKNSFTLNAYYSIIWKY